jgi:hypothetical protein
MEVRNTMQLEALPIETAPDADDFPILLFCPEQGGWHTAVKFKGLWLAYIDTSIRLRPTHWLPVPSEPEQ